MIHAMPISGRPRGDAMTQPKSSAPRAAAKLDAGLRRVAILANPRAGSGKSRRIVDELVASLSLRELAPSLCWQREEFDALLDSPARAETRCVVAAGGDGTLLEVVNRAAGIPATVLPLGNENLVARYCQIERSGRKLAEVIAAGRLKRFDLARANGRLFCLMAGAGFDAEVVHRVHQRRRGHINKLTYAVPLLQALQAYPYPLVDVEIVDNGERLRGAMVFVFNLPRYAMGLPIAAEGSADDGLLDVCVFERPGALAMLRYLGAVTLRRHQSLPDFHHRLARRVRISASRPVPLQTDGDPAGCLPATIEVAPQALELVVPE
jgi:diacylglycerol kinase family enzyme